MKRKNAKKPAAKPHSASDVCPKCGCSISFPHFVKPRKGPLVGPFCMGFCARAVANQVGGVVINDCGEVRPSPNVNTQIIQEES